MQGVANILRSAAGPDDIACRLGGDEFCLLVKAEHPDLIILDLMLPELDGLEVCKRIRLNQETALLPILMLTAKAEESDTVIGLELKNILFIFDDQNFFMVGRRVRHAGFSHNGLGTSTLPCA